HRCATPGMPRTMKALQRRSSGPEGDHHFFPGRIQMPDSPMRSETIITHRHDKAVCPFALHSNQERRLLQLARGPLRPVLLAAPAILLAPNHRRQIARPSGAPVATLRRTRETKECCYEVLGNIG